MNARFRRMRTTGVQRVADALSARLSTSVRDIEPAAPAEGLRGHLWEQVVLPGRVGDQLLWSPCNTGPVVCDHQVVTLHDAAVLDHPEWFSRSFRLAYRTLWPALARRAAQIVTVSEDARGRLARALHIPEAQIMVAHNGVDPQFHPVSQQAAAEVATRYGVRPNRYFVTLSTLEPRKNLALVAAAWREAAADLPADMSLLVVGGAGDGRIFAGGRLQQAEGLVRTGYVPDEDLPSLLSGARALLYPSLYEGFGLPVLEAMACGTAAVTTRETSLPEVGGEAALYVDSHDPSDLARKIRALAVDDALRDHHGRLGLERARRFSWDASAAAMDDLFRRLA